MIDIKRYQIKLNKAEGKKELLLDEYDRRTQLKTKQEQRLQSIEKAQALIQQVAKDTQSKIQFHIEDIVQLALSTCFPNKYKFKVDFTVERNRTVAKLLFLEHDKEIDPMSSSGGGVVDIASFALRLAAWTLSKTRSIIILDEPFKFLSRDLHLKAGEILKELSEKLKLQIIMVTHNPQMMEISDKIFEVQLKEKDGYKISAVKEIENIK